MNDNLALWIHYALNRHLAANRGKVIDLTHAINAAAVGHSGTCELDWRTVRNLVENPERVRMGMPQLLTLHFYFLAKTGAGLDWMPLFMPHGIVSTLTQQSSRIVILMGAKPRPKDHRADITRWDTLCVGEVLAQLHGPGRSVDVDIRDVVLGPECAGRHYANEEWHRLIAEDRTSLVAVGSPRACLASEVMLARMFDVEPFVKDPVNVRSGRGDPLPFRFIWPARLASGVPSSFAWGVGALTKDHAALRSEILRNRAAALWWNDALHRVPVVDTKPWDSLGVIAAQRRPGGHVWVVLSGVSGPMTLAAGRLLAQIRNPLPPPDAQGPRTLCLKIKAKLQDLKALEYAGDSRELSSPCVDGDPIIFPRE